MEDQRRSKQIELRMEDMKSKWIGLSYIIKLKTMSI